MTETAKMYGGSLYGLAAEEGIETELLPQVEGTAKLFADSPDYLHLLSLPNLPKKERCGLIDEAFGGQVHAYVVNFLKILCENGLLRELSGCAAEFRARYNAAHGIVEAAAVSAVALTDAEKARLEEKLSAMTGKTVHVHNRVDPTVLGGIRLDMEGERLDGTVQARLEALRRDIAGTVL
jgi:F-type H+-transporting ATPase subunit delta